MIKCWKSENVGDLWKLLGFRALKCQVAECRVEVPD